MKPCCVNTLMFQGMQNPQDASSPRSSSSTPSNSAKHSNIPSLKPPQLISSYHSVSIPNSTKIQTVKEEPFDKSTAIKEDKSSGILYERQKEELQRFYMFQQQRLLEQKRKSEKKNETGTQTTKFVFAFTKN